MLSLKNVVREGKKKKTKKENKITMNTLPEENKL